MYEMKNIKYILFKNTTKSFKYSKLISGKKIDS